jgi:hypothetical protein
MAQTITKIKTFEDACNVKGIDANKVLPDVSTYPEAHQKALIAAAKLFIIVDAVNGDSKFDWSDWDQPKYYPWWDLETEENNPSGFRLHDVYCLYSDSTVGSRLCFHTREEAEQVATDFIDLYRDMIKI